MPIYLNNIEVPFFKYPGGELDIDHNFFTNNYLKFPDKKTCHYEMNVIMAYLYSSDDIIKLCMLKKALDCIYLEDNRLEGYVGHVFELHIPYLPYGRHDRISNKSYTFGLDCIGNIINSLKFYSVKLYDCHSENSRFYISNSSQIKAFKILKKFENDIPIINSNKIVLIAPDKGSYERTYEVADQFSLPMYCASKTRDPNTGKIQSISIDGNFKNEDCLLIDDICDGGSTFIELAKILKEKGANDIYLYVTNGIFSNGFDELKKYFKKIYCFNVHHTESFNFTNGIFFNNFKELRKYIKNLYFYEEILHRDRDYTQDLTFIITKDDYIFYEKARNFLTEFQSEPAYR